MSTGIPNGMAVVHPDTGKTIDNNGVVVVRNARMLEESQPHAGKGAIGIISRRALVLGDTTGPLTQVKLDTWKGVGVPDTDPDPAMAAGLDQGGSFDLHDHAGDAPMGELFIIVSGSAHFRYLVPGGPQQEVTLGPGGQIYFPPGVRHAGRCVSEVSAEVIVIGVREARHPCDGDQKGVNIPLAY